MVVIVDEEGVLKEMEILGELREFREMFVDIQIMVNNILFKNKKISNDVLELKVTV